MQLDTGDVSAFDTFVQSVQSALKSLGATHVDYLVNNAGNNHRNMAFEKTTEEELDSLYNVHFKGVFFRSEKLLPLIKDGGRMVNVSTGRTRIIGSSVPSHHRARPILTFRNDVLKICVLDRMILGPYSQSLIGRLEIWLLGYGPGSEDSVYLQANVVVQSTSIMFLDHKDAIASRPIQRLAGSTRDCQLLLNGTSKITLTTP